jgi:hypothetical protein
MRTQRTLAGILLVMILIFQGGCATSSKEERLVSDPNQAAFQSANSMIQSRKDINPSDSLKLVNLKFRISTYVPNYDGLGQEGRLLIESRLSSEISKYGIASKGSKPRFIIGMSINLLEKNITSTVPTKFSNTYEVVLMGIDVKSELIYDSYNIRFKGIGTTPTKAFINAFRDFRFRDNDFISFLENVDRKIDLYYSENCESIINDSKMEAKRDHFEAAYVLLEAIPQEARFCYSQARDLKSRYYQLSLNKQCQELLAAMRTELGKANDETASGFNEAAMDYYRLIVPKMDCYNDAQKIYNKYISQLDAKGKRDWEAKVKAQDFENQLQKDSMQNNLKNNDIASRVELEGNKRLLQKYQYDELPWIRKIFHLGDYDPFDRIDN